MGPKTALALLLILQMASALSPLSIGEMEARVTFSGQVELSSADPSAGVNWLEASFYNVPQPSQLQSAELVSAYPANHSLGTDDYGNSFINFRWDRPSLGRLSYRLAWDVDVSRLKYAITGPGSPGGEVPGGVMEFLTTDNLTEWTPFMKSKALSITAGSNSTLEAVRRLSAWVSAQLAYDTSCWEGSFPAIRVFSERRGVCDEFTNLFVSFCRSLKIPARYVSGLVYSGEVWNFHAWAEVYLGESGGWVPVDPTYNEVGFVDSTHISLATVHGARDLSSFKKLSWQGDRGVIGGFGEESLGVEITGSSPQQLVSVSVGAPGRMDGGEMANVTATITNQANSLAVATCSLAMPEEMWLLDSREKSALIGPGGSAQLSWAIASPRSLDKKFLHRMPIDISCFPGANRTVTVVIDPKAEKPPVPRASLTDLTVINASTVSVRFMNSGTQVLDGLVVELCVRDGERYCMNKSSAALGPGAAGQVDYALSISDGDTVEVAFFSEDFKSLYEEAVSIKPEPPAPQPSGFVGNPERALEEAGEPMMLIIVLVVLILIILSAIAAAVRRR